LRMGSVGEEGITGRFDSKRGRDAQKGIGTCYGVEPLPNALDQPGMEVPRSPTGNSCAKEPQVKERENIGKRKRGRLYSSNKKKLQGKGIKLEELGD